MRDKLEELGRERAAGDFMQAETGDGSWTYSPAAMARLNCRSAAMKRDFRSAAQRRPSAAAARSWNLRPEYRILVGTRMTDYDDALKRLDSILWSAVPALLLSRR